MSATMDESAAARERQFAERLPVPLPDRPLGRDGAARRSVLLVGAGAVNLVLAWRLHSSGLHVTLVDAHPDPLEPGSWKRMGSTFGGYGARIFSLTEARQHHRRSNAAAGESSYRRPLVDGGWLCCPPDHLDAADWRWIEAHERLTGAHLTQYGSDIESFNVESDPLWAGMRETAPDLFTGVSFREPLLRLYPDAAAFDRAAAHEATLIEPPEPITAEALARRQPMLADAVDAGEIAGALRVRGFSVDMHAFGRKLIASLARAGVAFRWNVRAQSILFAADNRVAGIASSEGALMADFYVLSPGAYGRDLLAGTRSQGKVAAVAGGWVSLPNDSPSLDVPLKISRRGFGAPGPAEGANVVPAVDAEERGWLHISSAHGFLGLSPEKLGGESLHHLTEPARQTARRYFPAATRAAGDALVASERYCVRPWTPTGLGLFETVPAVSGGVLVIATGHNTGGFAQSPAIAEAVLAAFSGERHRMHALYHPDRAELAASQ